MLSRGTAVTDIWRRTDFIHCDVTNWEDQAHLFHSAAARSPSGRIDYVVANAGISTKDDVFTYDGTHHTLMHTHLLTQTQATTKSLKSPV